MNDKYPATTDTPDEPMFDVAGAERERLDWRLRGKQPTERALGIQEGLDRAVSDEIKTKLGEDALKSVEPEQ